MTLDRHALILNAGASLRMGRRKSDLPMSPFRPEGPTFLDRALELARVGCGNDQIVVVSRGGQELRVGEGVRFVDNPSPGRGMFSSLQVGLAELVNFGAADLHVVLLLVDHPLVRPDTLGRLWAAAERAGATSVIPTYGGRPGHPIVLGPALVDRALQAPWSARLDALQESTPRLEVAVPDPGILRSIDTPTRYRWFFGPL